MKKKWPQIKKVENHGTPRFMVDARFDGQGERKFFSTKEQAEGFAQVCRLRRHSEGISGFDANELKAFGWSVTDAIKFALEHLRRESASISVTKAVEALVTFKEKTSNVGATRLSDIKNRLKRFAESVGAETKISLITPEKIGEFLCSIPTPTTRNDYRKEVVMLWGFAKSRGWVAEPLDKHLVPRTAEPEKARVILSVAQSAALMRHSLDDDIRALNALVLFGGCRREEVEKMNWSHIDFESGHINITAEISKVRTERFAPLNDTLRAWLLTIPNRKGQIIPRHIMRPLRAVWKAAGLYPWPQDAHRHSFISYRRTIVGDSLTALEAGTSETIIKRHYKRPVSKQAADRFFAIRPSGEGS